MNSIHSLVILTYIFFYMPSYACSLFRKFPTLETQISYTSLCDVPTPIIKAEYFAQKIRVPELYIKRDDLTGKVVGDQRLYGGNKLRKLEWLLADAIQKHARTIITYGNVGSNHALATAVYGRELNFNTILMLKSQPNSYVVRQNLMLDYNAGAQLYLFSDTAQRDKAKACEKLLIQDPHTYFIPTGGSTPLGTLGFVNAACELYEQIQAQVIPEPDRIYTYWQLWDCSRTIVGIKNA